MQEKTFLYIFFAFSQNITKSDKGVVIKYLGILQYLKIYKMQMIVLNAVVRPKRLYNLMGGNPI